MELQRMKLENVKRRISRGEKIVSTSIDNGEYIVKLANGPAITFDENYKSIVDKTIEKASNGIRGKYGWEQHDPEPDQDPVGHRSSLKSDEKIC